MTKKNKEVYIKGNNLAWFVVPVSRNKYQRHSLAQFDRKLFDIEYVKNWISNQNNLVMTKGIVPSML
jgi:hypothetical protein